MKTGTKAWKIKVPKRLKSSDRSPNTPNGRKQGFGRRLREAREDAGLSQKAMLDRLGWPSESNARLSNYETERSQPTVQDWELMCAALKVNPCRIVFGHYKYPEEVERLASAILNATPGERAIFNAMIDNMKERARK